MVHSWDWCLPEMMTTMMIQGGHIPQHPNPRGGLSQTSQQKSASDQSSGDKPSSLFWMLGAKPPSSPTLQAVKKHHLVTVTISLCHSCAITFSLLNDLHAAWNGMPVLWKGGVAGKLQETEQRMLTTHTRFYAYTVHTHMWGYDVSLAYGGQVISDRWPGSQQSQHMLNIVVTLSRPTESLELPAAEQNAWWLRVDSETVSTTRR